MQAMFGAVALSAFKNSKLLQTLQAKIPPVKAVHAQFVHFVNSKTDLSVDQLGVMQSLLSYGYCTDIIVGE